MSFTEILIISISLAMDSFAVSICKGLSMDKMSWKKAIIIGLYFGIFQAGMPLIGYFLGSTFESFITSIDHWITFILLGVIGLNTIKEALTNDEEKIDDSIDFKVMIALAIATSIDALAVGITFAFMKVNLLVSLLTIGLTAFTLSMLGVKLGNKFGDKHRRDTEILGGVVLIIIGIKILLEHLFGF